MAKHIARKAEARRAPDALDSLTDEKSVVHRLFDAFDQAGNDADPARKAELAQEIFREIAAKTRSGNDNDA